MKTLGKILQKNNKIIVGLMSGTSADGIDAAIISVTGHGLRTNYNQIAFSTFPYPAGFKKRLMDISRVESARIDDIARYNILTGRLFAEAALKIIRKAGMRPDDADLIGSHGQTICHLPSPVRLFGKKINATLQIGHPSVIAKNTGIITVGDFRISDIAVGGSGAPLVPMFDYIMFRSAHKNRILLNIGGIANVTILPKGCPASSVTAFDTGPGNMIIDYLMQRFYGKPCDDGGKTAFSGRIIPHLLARMMKHPYLGKKPPKSTGREIFGEEYAEKIISRGKDLRKKDVIATITEFTAVSIYDACRRFVRRNAMPHEIVVSGGGVHNDYIMEALRHYFSGADVCTSQNTNIDPDAKEAVCFAILANETLHSSAGNIRGATGAKRGTILGTVSLP